MRNLIFIAVLILFNSSISYANSRPGHSDNECYSVAMVGFDSVINSHLGIPLHQVIDTFVEGNDNKQMLDIYRDYLLYVVMGAYQWSGTPHAYLAKTIVDCANRKAEVAMH